VTITFLSVTLTSTINAHKLHQRSRHYTHCWRYCVLLCPQVWPAVVSDVMNTFIRQSGRKDSKKDIYTAIKKKIKNVISRCTLAGERDEHAARQPATVTAVVLSTFISTTFSC